jgi:hypothetical protein
LYYCSNECVHFFYTHVETTSLSLTSIFDAPFHRESFVACSGILSIRKVVFYARPYNSSSRLGLYCDIKVVEVSSPSLLDVIQVKKNCHDACALESVVVEWYIVVMVLKIFKRNKRVGTKQKN